jgi:glucose-1-phosphate cytidylyltransferase
VWAPASGRDGGAAKADDRIGGRPILWQIVKLYAAHGLMICLGYRGYMIKKYFANFRSAQLRRDDRRPA